MATMLRARASRRALPSIAMLRVADAAGPATLAGPEPDPPAR